MRFGVALLAVGTALAIAACGSGDDDDEPRVATATPSPAATRAVIALKGRPPRALVGTWRRRITAEDWRSLREEFPAGPWRFEIMRRGRVDVYLPYATRVDFSAELGVSGSALTIGAIPIC